MRGRGFGQPRALFVERAGCCGGLLLQLVRRHFISVTVTPAAVAAVVQLVGVFLQRVHVLFEVLVDLHVHRLGSRTPFTLLQKLFNELVVVLWMVVGEQV